MSARKTRERKHNEPFRPVGQTLGDAMREYAGSCYCDEPGPGESGIIICPSCAMLTWAKEADELLAACEIALNSTAVALGGHERQQLAAAIAKARAT